MRIRSSRQRRARHQRRPAGRPLHRDPHQAARDLRARRRRPALHGAGRPDAPPRSAATIEVPTLGGKAEIELPEGTQHGKTFRLRGKGIKGVRSSYPGDLYCHVSVETPVKLTEHQRKLLKELDESLPQGRRPAFAERQDLDRPGQGPVQRPDRARQMASCPQAPIRSRRSCTRSARISRSSSPSRRGAIITGSGVDARRGGALATPTAATRALLLLGMREARRAADRRTIRSATARRSISGPSSSRSCCSASAARSRSTRACTSCSIPSRCERLGRDRDPGVRHRRRERLAVGLPARGQQGRAASAGCGAGSARVAAERADRDLRRGPRRRSVGLALALAFICLAMVTGNPMLDAIGTLAIGVLLVVVAVFVGVEVKALLIGQSVETGVLDEMRAHFVEAAPRSSTVYNLLTLQLGPDVMVAVKARDAAGDLSAPALIEAINRVEQRFQARVSADAAGCSSSPTSPTERRAVASAQPNRSLWPSGSAAAACMNCVRSSSTRSRSRPKRASPWQALRSSWAQTPSPCMRELKVGVVVLAAAHLAHPGHDARGAIGKVLVEPALEERVHFPGQAQDDAERRARAGRRGGFEDALDLRLVDERDDRRDAHAHRHAGPASASIVRRRRCGAAARGSRMRASAGSSEVTET